MEDIIRLKDNKGVVLALKNILQNEPIHDLRASGCSKSVIQCYRNGGYSRTPTMNTFSNIVSCYNMVLKLRDFSTGVNVYGTRKIGEYLLGMYNSAPSEMRALVTRPNSDGMLFDTVFRFIYIFRSMGLAVVHFTPKDEKILLSSDEVREIETDEIETDSVTITEQMESCEIKTVKTAAENIVDKDQINNLKEFISSNLDAYINNLIDKDTLIKIINDSLSRI